MKKEHVTVLILILFISTAFFPLCCAQRSNTKSRIENTVLNKVDRPKIEVFLPDVHVYYLISPVEWGIIEFDEPGAIVDVDLSDFEEDEILIKFTQNIVCHMEMRILPAFVISSIVINEEWAGSTFEFVRLFENWKDSVSHAYYLINRAEDDIYPIKVAITGVPALYGRFVNIYYSLLMNIFPKLFDIPSSLEESYGKITEYQLHVHS
jgi:hypothetical protein